MINIEVGNPVQDAFMLFMQTADAIQKYADSTLYKRVKLSTSKYAVLQILAVNNGIMTPSEISRWILRERHNVTTLVARMKRDGFIVVEPNAADRRSVNVILTDKGREKLEDAKPVAREIVDYIMASMSDRNLSSMTKSLNILRKNAYNGLADLSKYPRKRL